MLSAGPSQALAGWCCERAGGNHSDNAQTKPDCAKQGSEGFENKTMAGSQ
jgi:hypothetical protein